MNLNEFFEQNKHVALAFSGGVDSAYLLYKGSSCGCDIHAYYVKSAFQPQFELDDALRLAGQLGVSMTVLTMDVLSDPQIAENPSNRCYYCKHRIFQKIKEAAVNDGYTLLIDGTNASDDAGDRPGMKALTELSVRSPLLECGLTKAEIRALSKDAGLFTWNKPSYACLATRIPTGTRITYEQLSATENAENYLAELGFHDFRVRLLGTAAKIQIREEQLELLLQCREDILQVLGRYYSSVTLDLEVRS